MPVMARYQAIREAWLKMRADPDLRAGWATASGLLRGALDADLDRSLLEQFAERTHLLARQIGAREPLIAGPGLTLNVALRVMDETLRARAEQARTPEVMDVLVRLDALDDHEDLA
jgi:hypothetical protein